MKNKNKGVYKDICLLSQPIGYQALSPPSTTNSSF